MSDNVLLSILEDHYREEDKLKVEAEGRGN